MDGCYDSAYFCTRRATIWEIGSGGAGEAHIRARGRACLFTFAGGGGGSSEENPHMLAFGVKGMCVTCICQMGRGRGRPGRG